MAEVAKMGIQKSYTADSFSQAASFCALAFAWSLVRNEKQCTWETRQLNLGRASEGARASASSQSERIQLNMTPRKFRVKDISGTAAEHFSSPSLEALQHSLGRRVGAFFNFTMSAKQLAAFGQRHIAKGIGRLAQEVIASGKGSYVNMVSGRRFLDFTCGIGVVNLGHCHPAITAAAQEQVATVVHGQVNIAYHKKYLELIEALLPLMPDKSLDTFFFWNSGSEAVEAAVKLARHATKKQNIIVMQGSYHGRTMGTMAMTRSKTVYGQNYGPLMPGVFEVDFPYCAQCSIAKHAGGKFGFEELLHGPN